MSFNTKKTESLDKGNKSNQEKRKNKKLPYREKEKLKNRLNFLRNKFRHHLVIHFNTNK